MPRASVAGTDLTLCEPAVAGVGVVGLEYFEPLGGLGGSLDDPESCGRVEQARLEDLGLVVLALCFWDDLHIIFGKTRRPLLGSIVERIGWERGLTVLKDRVRAASALAVAGPGEPDTFRAGQAGTVRLLAPARR